MLGEAEGEKTLADAGFHLRNTYSQIPISLFLIILESFSGCCTEAPAVFSSVNAISREKYHLPLN